MKRHHLEFNFSTSSNNRNESTNDQNYRCPGHFKRHTSTGFELCCRYHCLGAFPTGHKSDDIPTPEADRGLLCKLCWKSERNSRRPSTRGVKIGMNLGSRRIHFFGVGLAECRGLLHFSNPFVIGTQNGTIHVRDSAYDSDIDQYLSSGQ